MITRNIVKAFHSGDNAWWRAVFVLIALSLATGCNAGRHLQSSAKAQSSPMPTTTATVPHDVVAVAVIPPAPAADPAAACLPEASSANAEDKAGDAKVHFDVGMKYFLEANQTGRDPLLGNLLSTLTENAHTHFSRAIELNPDLALAYVYRAATASLQGAEADAILADLNKAGKVDENIHADLHYEVKNLAARISSQAAVSQQ